MKVYFLPNADGVHSYLVAAKNQKEAAKLMGSTVGHFRSYGGQRTTRPEFVSLAMSEPGRVWRRKIWAMGPNPWEDAYPHRS